MDVASLSMDIAVIGISCAFPGAENPGQFWENINGGVESLTRLGEPELLASGEDPEVIKSPAYVPVAACTEGVDLFDAEFFGITPRDAAEMDPQHRLFLEHSWRALEAAGYDPRGTGVPVGVYAGEGINSYVLHLRAVADAQALRRDGQRLEGVGALGNDTDFLTTRVSYALNLTGPSIPISTACSSSLVAVHLACQALRTFECDMALAGGVAVTPPVRRGYLHVDGGILSADGHTRAFDERSSGTVLGSGVGIVVLKRLEDALAHGDAIEGIIRGSAINNDGASRAGFAAPGVDGQAEVIALAQGIADVHPDTVTYLEAHGTGTRVGDPIEIAALTKTFREQTDRSGYCALGSVKANIGHMDAAAGVAGLIKALYAAKHGRIPPQINFTRPNPALRLGESPFRIVTEAEPWITPPGVPRRAGVSSFGFGGTNAHAIIEEPPGRDAARESEEDRVHILPLSARDDTAARAAARSLAAHLERNQGQRLADVAHTLQARARFSARIAVAARTVPGAIAELGARAETGSRRSAHGARAAFLFPGQGAQYAGMAAGLYRELPAFATEFSRCSAAFEASLGADLAEIVFSGREPARLDQTRFAQPALFAVEYALARALIAAGVRPACMIGHSVGEIVAATVAGVLELQDAARVIDTRARLMAQSPPGAMLAVRMPAGEAPPLPAGDVELAAVNGPRSVVLSGDADAIAELASRLASAGAGCTRLRVPHAYHSRLMGHAAEEFARFMATVPVRPPQIPYASNVTGGWIAEGDLRGGDYWGLHIRQAVRFQEGLARVAAAADGALVEVGPGRSLLAAAKECGHGDAGRPLLATMRRAGDSDGDGDLPALAKALAALWEHGSEIDFTGWPGTRGRTVALPTYPFQRRSYWVNPGPSPAASREHAAGEPAADPWRRREDQQRWLSMPGWQTLPPSRHGKERPARPGAVPVLLVGDGGPLAGPLASALQAAGHPVSAAGNPADIAGALTAAQAGYARCSVVFADGVRPIRDMTLPEPVGADHPYTRLLALAKTLAALDSGPVDLTVVTNGAFDVAGDEQVAPDRQLLVGIAQVIPKELPHVTCRVVDIDLADPAEQTAAELAGEIGVHAGAAVTAYRHGKRWKQGITELAVPGPGADDCPLRFRGVYLITGGLGGIGLSVARFLARQYQARLVLTSRSELPPPRDWDARLAAGDVGDPVHQRLAALREIEALGGRVAARTADAGDEAAMTDVVQDARQRFGRLDGVIHAAGLAGGGLIESRDSTAFASVLWPKVAGVRSLYRAVGGQPLDFFALFSSLSTVDAWDGTADYTAANAYLDGFAHWARQRGRHDLISINWTGWNGLGMTAGTPASSDETSLSEPEGHVAFTRALSTRLPQVHVATHDLGGVHERGQRLNARVHARPAPAAARARVARDGYEAPAGDAEQFIAGLYAALLGLEQVGRDDSFFGLGGDSLTALDLVSQIRRRYRHQTLLQDVFDHATPRELAAHLAAQAGKEA